MVPSPRSWAAALLVCLVVLSATTAALPVVQHTGEAEHPIAAWMSAHGGKLGAEVRTVVGNHRGVFATRDYSDGELIGWLPFSATVPLPLDSSTGQLLLPELARRVFDPANAHFWNGTEQGRSHGGFWASQPAREELLAWDEVPPDALAELEELPALATSIGAQMAHHRRWHAGLADALATEGAAFNVSYEQYVQLALLATTRSFGFMSEAGACCDTVLLPGFDMLNTALPYTATRAAVAADSVRPRRVEVRAVGRLAAGTQLVWLYHATHTPRNDLRFLLYGYVEDGDERLLAADALVDGVSGFDSSSPTEERAELAGMDPPAAAMSSDEAAAELARVLELSASLAPLEADRRRLAALADPWAHAAVALRLRIVRKVALAARAAAMRARLDELALEGASAPDSAAWPLVAAVLVVLLPAACTAGVAKRGRLGRRGVQQRKRGR